MALVDKEERFVHGTVYVIFTRDQVPRNAAFVCTFQDKKGLVYHLFDGAESS